MIEHKIEHLNHTNEGSRTTMNFVPNKNIRPTIQSVQKIQDMKENM